ncbi:PREDICTED: probable glutathione S-transferase [Nelumbo nucifera]|uniref:glutathione transferase n=1 Tax=Nelumbo nucifera TaxID=4432 RepID=A0A1U8BNZ8_NELNU|nr:PREDICTED: probable glutathione S-transferase [Nelumbo nucifera]
MGSPELKLFGAWFSPFSFRVKLALKLKGIQYEYAEEDLQNKSPELLKYSPVHKKIPVLVHDGKPIVESLIILEYIDETWKQNPLLPEDPYERAMVRFWVTFAEEKFIEALRRALFSEGTKQEKEVKQIAEALEILERELKGKKFFGGETIGFLDIALSWVPAWLGVMEEVASFKVFDSNKFPCFKEWMDNFQEFSITKETFPPRDELLVFFQNFRQLKLASTNSN